MQLITRCEALEAVLNDWREVIGTEFQAYSNHCYRVLNGAYALLEAHDLATDEHLQTIGFALGFHDLGIWSDADFDYLQPSGERAQQAMAALEWPLARQQQVLSIIARHHQFTAVLDEPLTEAVRQADWCDVSLGLMRGGIAKARWRQISKRFANAGFHQFLLRKGSAHALRHPLRPMPMLRWR
ncbi:hypothetical protein DFR26_1522 [Paraperlucidibaca baekdonensis]|uniref:HD domain-containing protein n=1 Tax=Paraperlucidibaca baekdonensis TaxID=748120 RepID=A0A3E0H536_9GAMM|nr:hypothetical protein [Paraperlucidibaca baekdonensis]REH37740.1 hypothetical protein DFR26_1522 [Paraperlucidibaca baekdonensis]